MANLWQSLAIEGGGLAHLAAALITGAMLVQRLALARLLALGAGLAALALFAAKGAAPDWIVWALLFVVICAAQLAIAWQRSRRGELLPSERALFEHVMQIEEPAHQRRLRDVIVWQDVLAGELLMRQGDAAPPLIFIAHGAASITHDGRPVGVCGAGDFLGEMSLVSGARASATVEVTEAMRIARIDRDALAQLARSIPEIAKAFDAALNRSLAAKVLRMNEAAAGQGAG